MPPRRSRGPPSRSRLIGRRLRPTHVHACSLLGALAPPTVAPTLSKLDDPWRQYAIRRMLPARRGVLERLGLSDYQSVLNFVREIHGIERMDDFPRRAMAGICHLIESDMATYNEIDTRRRRAFIVQEPAGALSPAQVRTFER